MDGVKSQTQPSDLPATPPASQKPSFRSAFQSAQKLVQVLASILYGVGLLTLIQMAVLAAGGGLIAANAVATGVANLFALVVALNSLLLGKGVTRGSYVSWLATLILTALFVVQGVLSILTAPTGSSALVIVVPVPVCAVAVLALLLTRAVRQHCPKKVTPAR